MQIFNARCDCKWNIFIQGILCIPFKERGKGQMTEKNPKMVKETRDIDHDLLAFDLKEHP